ncbi:hypothetical protein V1264_014742 [Littorina saxatilis]|uniref:Uncharacterized protein n=1 Tax=Littorina saxatilis TaxID=31220 RepID=A0AAN9BTN0_9CAEN
MDYRIFFVRTWSCACVYTRGCSDTEESLHTKLTLRNKSLAERGDELTLTAANWMKNPARYRLSYIPALALTELQNMIGVFLAVASFFKRKRKSVPNLISSPKLSGSLQNILGPSKLKFERSVILNYY